MFSLKSRPVIAMLIVFATVWSATLAWRLNDEPREQAFSHDAAEYSAGAVYLLQDGMYSLDGITPTFEREPGQSLYLAAIYAVFGVENRIAIYLIDALLYLAAALVFVREFARINSRRASLIALGLLLTLPSGFHVIFSLNREVLALSLGLLLAASLLKLLRLPTFKTALLSGALLGLLVITYMPLLLLPVFLGPLLLLWRIPWQKIAVLFLCSAVPLALWAGRNQIIAGQPSLSGTFRPAAAWYVRGQQAEHLRGIEPFMCLWAEYISRDWSNRSEFCSFNGIKNRRWPQGITAPEEHIPAGIEGKALIAQYFPWYLWFSVFEVLELHLPFVDSWGLPYNGLAALSSLMLYVGVLLAIPAFKRKENWLFLAIIVYTTGVFIVTDATPRYLMPVIFCYTALAAIGYDRVLSRYSSWRA